MAGVDDLRPLDAAIDEIRLLHRAAERAASRIGSEAGYFGGPGSGTRGPVADIADALVERTEAIREDCRRLERLLERARAAVAADLGAAAQVPAQRPVAPPPIAPPPVAPAPPARVQAPEYQALTPAPGSVQTPREPSGSWRFWRRARRREAEPAVPPVSPPTRLPRPDFLGRAIDPLTQPREPGATGRQPIPEGVRLIASQMAVAGAGRTEVARRLQRQFRIGDPEPVLDEVFGSTPTPVE